MATTDYGRPWHQDVGLTLLRAREAKMLVSSAPSIVVTIGRETRVYQAFVTSAPIGLDAPATLTLYASTSAELAGFVAADVTFDAVADQSIARLVLVDGMELTWQRARYREAGHRLLPADEGLIGASMLQRWLWRRLFDAHSTR
jgi:hypothetical protein